MSYSPSKKKTWNTSDFWACSVQSPRPRAVLSTSAVLESLSDFRLCEGGGGRGGGKSTKCSKSFVRGCRGNCPKKALKQRWGNSADGKSKRRYRWTKLIYSPLWKCFWKDAVWSYLSCKTLLRSRALRYVVSLMIKKSQLPKVGTKVVRGFSFLAELSFLAGHLLDLIFVGKVSNFARVLNLLKGSVSR